MDQASTSCVVRPGSAGDLLGVLRLLERSPELTPEQCTDRQRSTWDRMLATEGLTVYVAEIDGTIVGTTSLLVMPNLGYDCCPTRPKASACTSRASPRN